MGPYAMSEPRKLIRDDWEPTFFAARMVEPEKVRCVLEGADRTPSYLNQQPWHFIIATKDDPAEYERLVSCISEVNVEWARRAPVLMLSVVRLHNGSNTGRNNHAFRDAGHAVSNLVVKAKAMGLAAQQMAGFDATKLRERFQIPVGFAPTTAIALGYPTDLNGSSVITQGGRGVRGPAPREFCLHRKLGPTLAADRRSYARSESKRIWLSGEIGRSLAVA